jgi:hypothetical protein
MSTVLVQLQNFGSRSSAGRSARQQQGIAALLKQLTKTNRQIFNPGCAITQTMSPAAATARL